MVFSVFSKTLLKNNFQKQEPNKLLVFSENYSCSLNLVFSMFSVFSKQKKNNKLGTRFVLVLHVFPVFLVFYNRKQFLKMGTKHVLNILLNPEPTTKYVVY